MIYVINLNLLNNDATLSNKSKKSRIKTGFKSKILEISSNKIKKYIYYRVKKYI